MKVTIKGQITIPIALRERFGFLPGTEVEFVQEGGALRVRACKGSREADSSFGQWLLKAAGSAKPGSTTDEMMALTRGDD